MTTRVQTKAAVSDSITLNATPVEGNLLLAFCGHSGLMTSVSAAGWNYETVAGGGGAGLRSMHLLWKIAGASEPTSITFTGTGASVSVVGVMELEDFDVADPIGVVAPHTGSGGAFTRLPAISGLTADGLLVGAATINLSGEDIGIHAGYTSRAYVGPGECLRVLDRSIGANTSFTAVDAANIPGVNGTSYASVLVEVKDNPNTPPNAPTNLAPNGATIDKDVTQRFSWTPSDPDPGDSQSKYDLRYRPVGTQTWTTVTATTSNTFRDFPAGTFAAEDYEWQVRTYDALGLVGPFSSSAFFTAATVPPGPTITDPVNGQTIPSADYTATVSYPDMESWEWRVLGDDGGNPDETDVIIPATTRPSTARTFHMQGLPNGVTVHPQVRVLEGGLWSQWVSSSNPVSFTPPAVPSVVASVDNQAGAIVVQATHPEPAGGQPAVVAVDWWRRRLLHDADGLVTGYDPAEGGEDGIPLARGASQPPSAMWTDWQVASGGVYEYRARARGDNETSSWSEWGGGPNAVTWGSNAVTWGSNAVSWS